MKKTLLLSSLLFTLFNSGCTKPLIVQSGSNHADLPVQVSTPQVMEPMQMPTQIPTVQNNVVSTAGVYHQLKTIQGSTLTVGERSNGFVFPQYQGKVVLLQIFGKDCPFCFDEMPAIRNVDHKYGQNLQVIAIQAQEPMSQSEASSLINRFQMNYPIIERDESRDLLFFIRQTYGWNGILPYTLLIKNGVTEYSFSGKVSQQEIDESVKTLF